MKFIKKNIKINSHNFLLITVGSCLTLSTCLGWMFSHYKTTTVKHRQYQGEIFLEKNDGFISNKKNYN